MQVLLQLILLLKSFVPFLSTKPVVNNETIAAPSSEASTIVAQSKRILLIFIIGLVSIDYIIEPVVNHFVSPPIDWVGINDVIKIVPILASVL